MDGMECEFDQRKRVEFGGHDTNQLVADMSTYNDSESQSEWLVSPVVDGKTGSLSLDDVQNGTSFAIDAYMDSAVSNNSNPSANYLSYN